MSCGKCFFGFLVLSMPLIAHSIGLGVSGNTCDNVILSKTLVSSAGSYFESYKDCTAGVSISGINSSVNWTLHATISSLNISLPVSVSINGGSFQYLSTGAEITLAAGTGSSISPIPVTVRISQIDVEDGAGVVINNAIINYRVVVD